MRFDTIDTFKVDELLLDKGNYRFRRADSQPDCIDKIFSSSPTSFRNMMKSISEDDLGDLLLVYLDPEAGPIVYDGNRRLSAIKVLYDPDLIDDRKTQTEAKALREKTNFNFDKIRAQVSSDRNLVLKTVYERHAGGKGISQISWTALANATFRFDEGMIQKGDYWYDLALLLELNSREHEAARFVYSKKYSHDVFRRIIRSAVQLEVIPEALFSKRNLRVNQTPKKRLDQAMEIVVEFLRAMEAGELTLARDETFADKKKVVEYLTKFVPTKKSPDKSSENQESEDKNAEDGEKAGGDPDVPGGSSVNSNPSEGASSSQPLNSGGGETASKTPIKIGVDIKTPTRIESSDAVVILLNELGSTKLSSLYKSFLNVSLKENPALVMIGAWAFWETISRSLGANDGTSFESFLNGRINNWFKDLDKGKKSSLRRALKEISEEGNCNKHCAIYFSPDAFKLDVHFKVLEPLLIKCLETLVDQKDNGEFPEF